VVIFTSIPITDNRQSST